ncbi:MAG TPA: phosphopantetheine-binding protein [Terriglobales bacterium]|nr:phosphopantetheine-binding protein [Terriglobales bacterium]
MADELTARVVKILATVKRVPAENIRPEATLEELGIDSLDKVNVLFELESEFNIEIPDEEARQITSVQQIVERLRPVVEKSGA